MIYRNEARVALEGLQKLYLDRYFEEAFEIMEGLELFYSGKGGHGRLMDDFNKEFKERKRREELEREEFLDILRKKGLSLRESQMLSRDQKRSMQIKGKDYVKASFSILGMLVNKYGMLEAKRIHEGLYNGRPEDPIAVDPVKHLDILSGSNGNKALQGTLESFRRKGLAYRRLEVGTGRESGIQDVTPIEASNASWMERTLKNP